MVLESCPQNETAVMNVCRDTGKILVALLDTIQYYESFYDVEWILV